MNNIFDQQIHQLRQLLNTFPGKRETRTFDPTQNWPLQDRPALILSPDLALELGHPATPSISLFMWTSPANVQHGHISLLGPDLSKAGQKRLSWGKIMLFGLKECKQEDDFYPYYRQLADLRYDIHLQGILLRSASTMQREWIRVSRQAMDNGFSLFRFGQSIMDRYLQLEFVQHMELIIIADSSSLIHKIIPLADKTGQIFGALNKMTEEIRFDCSSCEYQEICREVAPLRAMHKTREQHVKNG